MISETLYANGNSTVDHWRGGDGTVMATGTFGAGTVKLQSAIAQAGPWFDCKDSSGVAVTLTADGAFSFSISACKLRVNLAGATAPSLSIQVAPR